VWRSVGYHECALAGSRAAIEKCSGYGRVFVFMCYPNLKGKYHPLDEVFSMLLEGGRSTYSRPPDLCKVGIGSGGGGSPSVYSSRGTLGYRALRQEGVLS